MPWRVDLMSGDAGNDVHLFGRGDQPHDLIANRRTTLTESDTLHFKSTLTEGMWPGPCDGRSGFYHRRYTGNGHQILNWYRDWHNQLQTIRFESGTTLVITLPPHSPNWRFWPPTILRTTCRDVSKQGHDRIAIGAVASTKPGHTGSISAWNTQVRVSLGSLDSLLLNGTQSLPAYTISAG